MTATATALVPHTVTLTLGDEECLTPTWVTETPMFLAVGPVGQFLLAADYRHCCVIDGLPAAEWVEGLEEYCNHPSMSGADKPERLRRYLAEGDVVYDPAGDLADDTVPANLLESVLDATTQPAAVPGPVVDEATSNATVEAMEAAAAAGDAATTAADATAAATPETAAVAAAGDLVPSSVQKAGERAGKLIWGADCGVMVKRCAAGLVCHTELVKQREKAASPAVWVKRRAAYVLAMEAAVETESGVACTLSALIGTHMAATAMAGLADMDVTTWSKGVSFACGRELIPLVERDANAETWAVKPGIMAELALLAKQLTSGRMSAPWVKGKVKELVALHLTRKAEQARALAATLGNSAADQAAAVKLANEAAAADKAAAAKLAPKVTTAAKAAAAATAVTAPVKPDGVKEMEVFEATLENLGGHVVGSAGAAPDCRAAHAWTLVGGSVNALEAFALRLHKESSDPEAAFHAVDVMVAALTRLQPAKVQAVVHRELVSGKPRELAK